MTEQQAELIPTPPGIRLRQAREALDLSIAQLSKKTRIRERIIQCIERDDTASIAPIYLRGYIKTYALAVKLDPAEFAAPVASASVEEPELRSVFNIDRKRGFGERWLKAGSYLVATVLIAALVWQVTQQAVQFSQGRGTMASRSGDSNPDVPASETAGSAAEGADARTTHLAASIASLEKLRSRPVGSDAAVEQAWSAIKEPLPAVPGHSMLQVSVSADSWIEITDANGERLEMDLLRGGNQRSYEGVAPFELMVGRASSVELIFDGEPVDLAPHINGDVARLTLGAAEPQTP